MAKWSDIGRLVGTIAPTIAAGIAGPLGGNAVAVLVNALGVKTDSADVGKQKEAIAQQFTGSPDQLLAMQKAEQEYKEAMAQFGFQNEKDLAALAVQDRESARARQIALKDWTVPFLVVAVTFGFFGAMFLISRYEIPKDSQSIVYSMIGVLGTAWIAIISYFFGSSAGSAAKQDIIAKATLQAN
jgi:hypothetical protein